MGFNDLGSHHPVAQGFPQIGNGNLVTQSQIRNVAKIGSAAPAPVPCNDGVGVGAANWDAGLREDSGAVSHVFIGGTQIQRHFQFQLWDGNNTEFFIRQVLISV